MATCFCVAGLTGLTLPASAQNAAENEELRRIIEAQQDQLEAQQEQLERLQETVDAQSTALQGLQEQLEANSTVTEALLVEEAMDLPDGSPRLETRNAAPVAEWDRLDTEMPTNSSVTYFGAARKGLVPGEGTQVAVHGLLELQAFHDTVGLNNNRFDTVMIPVDGGDPQTKFNVNPTQLAASSITSVDSGTVNTWLSIDFNGQLDRPEPRLRMAFAEYVSANSNWAVLAGKTYSTMLDMRAIPETLDFALPAGLWQQRQPLIRYTKSLSGAITGELAAETPENVTYLDNGGDARKLTRWPDISAAGTWFIDKHNIKHLRIAALVRDLGVEGSNGATDSAVGWSLSGSTAIGLPFLGERDTLRWTAHVGDGYGTQIKGGPVEGLFDTATSSLETIGVFGTFGGVQHFWSDKTRSNFAFGYVEADNPDFAADDTLKNTTYLAANFIWSPFKNGKFGVEYLWGQRENQNGDSGTTTRILLSSMVQF